MNWEGCRRKQLCLILRYHLRMILDRLRKSTEILSQDSLALNSRLLNTKQSTWPLICDIW
jgi:hypothetical protein